MTDWQPIETAAARWQWLTSQKFCQLYLERNADHATHYVSAKMWIEERDPEEFASCDPAEIQRMKDTDTIWRLHIYPDTPIGSYTWYGATAEYVIDRAMAALDTHARI